LILAEHNRDTIWFAGGKLVLWKGSAVHLGKGKSFKNYLHSGVKNVDFLSGCMVLFRASLLNTIGFEDERYFMYLDDIELSERIIRKGFKLLFTPNAVIYHKVISEREHPLKYYYSIRNRLLLIKETNKYPLVVLSYLFLFLILSVKLIKWKFTNRSFYKATLFGIIDYFNNKFYEGRGIEYFINYTDK